MITLYGAPGSVFVRKVKIFLLENQMKFKEISVNPLDKPLADSFLKISPLGKIPALTDSDFYISDSSVICAYLNKQYPSSYDLIPNNARHYAKTLWYEEWADTKLFSTLAPFYYQSVLVPLYYKKMPDYEKIEQAKKDIYLVNDYLEKSLNGHDYLVEDHFTLADISVAGVYFNMHYAGFSIEDYCSKTICDYLFKIFERPSFKMCVNDVVSDVNKSRSITEKLIAC